MSSAANLRRRELAAIHAARKDLGLDDETYREMLFQLTGERSAKGLNQRQRRQVLDHMRRLGAARKPRQRVAQHPGRPHNLDREPTLQKIEALLADMKLPWAYADAIARQQYGIERCAWLNTLDQVTGVIAALHVEQEKRQLLEQLQKLLQEKGIAEEELERRYRLRKGWRRHRPTLGVLIARLLEEDQNDG